MSDEKAKRAARAATERVAESRGQTVEEFTHDLERLATTDEFLFEHTGRRYWQTQYIAWHGEAAQVGRGEGGKATAERNKLEAEETTAQIAELWDKLNTTPERDRAGIIARRLRLTATTVRTHLKKAKRR